MKQSSILFALLFVAGALAAQTTPPNTIKIGALFGKTSYESLTGIGLGLQFDHHFKNHLALSLNGGFLQGKTSPSGSASGTDGNGVAYNNKYSYDVKEQLRHLDLTMLYVFNGKSGKNRFKIGGGPSVIMAALEYPVDIYIDRGVIIRNITDTHTSTVVMGNLIVENDFKITDRLVWSIRGTFRTAFGEKDILRRQVNYHDGLSATTSGITSNLALSLQLGYQF